MAHRFTNSPKAQHTLGSASDSTIDEPSHLQDTFVKFASIWKAKDHGGIRSFAQAYVELRQWLAEARCQGSSPNMQRIQQLLASHALKKALNGFKKSTSTGLCHLMLQSLKLAPLEVLGYLSPLLAQVAWIAMGPS